jgi:hypothetical protein
VLNFFFFFFFLDLRLDYFHGEKMKGFSRANLVAVLSCVAFKKATNLYDYCTL